MNCTVISLFTMRSTHTVTVFNYKGWLGSWPCIVRSCKSRSLILLLLKYDFPRLMDNHLLPLGNCFSSPIEVIGFAPIETINLIRNGGFFLYWLEFFYPIHWYWSLILEKIVLYFVPAHDLNGSHIHPSTCSSTLRTSPKSGGFCYIFYWLSCVSNKLFNSWHT